jgi:hypothetical protein
MFGVSRRISIGATASADHEASRSWTMWVKGKDGDSLMLVTGSTAGNRKFHIDPIGRVGIGTAPYVAGGFHTLTVGANEPYGAGLIKLRSQYNSGDGAEILQDPSNGTVTLNVNSTTSSLFIATSSGGRVGIGTAEPTEKLDVQGGYSFGTPGGVLLRNYSNAGTNLDMTALITGGWVGVHKITTADTTGNVYFGAFGGSSPSIALARSYWTVGNAADSAGAGYELTTGIHLLKNGYVGIGIVSPSYQLELSSDSAAKPGAGGLWTVSSDIRLKENIEEANYDTCYDIVKNLPLKRYTWKDAVYTTQQVADRTVLGWIAQDVQSVFPKAVTSSSFSGSGDFYLDDCLSLNAGQINAALYGTAKKLIVENESLKLQVSASNAEIQAIKTHLGL